MAPLPLLEQDFLLIISHPARQGFSFHSVKAALDQGIKTKFLTGLYFDREKFPYSLMGIFPKKLSRKIIQMLNKRSIPGMNPKNVISIGGPWLEIIFRPFSLFNEWSKIYDWLENRWLIRFSKNGTTVLHCFDGTSKRTLRSAHLKGIKTILELTIPPVFIDSVADDRARLGIILSERSLNKIRFQEKKVIDACFEADYCLAESWITVNTLLQLGILPNKIILSPLGVDIEHFHPKTTPRNSKIFTVLYMGQIGIRKGVRYLLDAWKDLDLPGSELVLAGYVNKSDAGDFLLEKYKGSFRWLGFVPDDKQVQLYQDADIFVLPSLADGSSLATHEAMACGLPCIISANVGCMVRDGIDGLVIPVRDIESLKTAIISMYNNSSMRQQMSIDARSRALHLSWEEYGRRLELMYRMIISGDQEKSKEILDMREL